MSPSQAAMSPIAWRSSSLRGSRAANRGIAATAGSETVSSWIRAIEATSCWAIASRRSTTRRARYGVWKSCPIRCG